MAETGVRLDAKTRASMTLGICPARTGCGDVVWLGRDRHCAACDRRILANDTEIECDVPETGTIFVSHLACYDAWQSVISAKE